MTWALFAQVLVATIACAMQLYVLRYQANKSDISMRIASWNAMVAPFCVIGMYYIYRLFGASEISSLLGAYSYSSFFVAMISLHLAVATVSRHFERRPKRLVIG